LTFHETRTFYIANSSTSELEQRAGC